MSVVSYNGSKLIPAPYVSLQKNYQTSSDGTKLSAIYQISITGKVLADKGSPYKNTGTGKYEFWTTSGYPDDNVVLHDQRLGALIRKREKIEQLFKEDGFSLEWQSADGSPPMKCNPRIISIQWTEGPWFNYIDYTITVEADVVYADGTTLGTDDLSPGISDAGENWSIEVQEEPENFNIPLSYRVTHTVNATGKRFYDENATVIPAYERAKTYVLSRMGYDSAIGSGFVRPPAYFSNVNHVKSENYDELAGSYSATETWLLASGIAKTEYNLSVRKSLDNPFTTVNIDGTITGFRTTAHPYANAKTVFSTESGLSYQRASALVPSPESLNTVPLSETIGHNPVTGSINYSFEYDSRPSNRFTLARSETVSINRDMYANPPAIIPVIGRTRGPVLQDLGTRKEYRLGLAVELVRHRRSDSLPFEITDSPTNATPYASELTTLVDSIKPTASLGASIEFIEQQTENFDLSTGRFSYNIQWVYEV